MSRDKYLISSHCLQYMYTKTLDLENLHHKPMQVLIMYKWREKTSYHAPES